MDLRRGSNNEQVKRVQSFLGLTSDGIFGPGTENSLRKWQSNNGLPPTGVVDSVVWARMFPSTPPVNTTSNVIQTTNLNTSRLSGHIPNGVLNQISETAQKFNITSNLRLAHFLSQCSHESGNFRSVVENLNYSSNGLQKTFPRYFNANNASQYANNPQRIANRVYSSRMGNGDEASGDGFRFRGRGYIQLTGRSNYTSFDRFVDEDIISNPDLVASKYPLMSAAFFFNSNKLWTICDRGFDRDTVVAVTRRVNGGTIGLDHRLSEFNKFWNLLK